MKHVKLTLIAKAATTLALACGLYGTASATIVPGVSLGAGRVVEQVNNLNHGKGIVFSFVVKGGPPQRRLANVQRPGL